MSFILRTGRVLWIDKQPVCDESTIKVLTAGRTKKQLNAKKSIQNVSCGFQSCRFLVGQRAKTVLELDGDTITATVFLYRISSTNGKFSKYVKTTLWRRSFKDRSSVRYMSVLELQLRHQ